MQISKKLLITYGLLGACLLISLGSGRYELSIKDIWLILSGRQSQGMAVNIFYNIRLVRSLEVLLCGMALAVAGQLYQSSFRNPLVSPDTLGVSGGASIGAIISILFFHDDIILRQLFSFGGGLIAVAFSLFLAKMIGKDKRISLLLAGIITGALADSLIMAFKYLADPANQLAVIDYWLMGSFSLINRNKLLATAVLVIPVLLLCCLFRQRLKLLLLKEDEARSLGANVSLLFCLSVALSTLLTAAAVSVSGIVSWIGLLTPHIVSLIFHGPFEDDLLLAMPAGGIVLLLADVLARTLTMAEIPISIITSFLGALILLFYLTFRKGGGHA